MPGIQRLSHTHDQVINWLLVNPHKSLRECADYFGYTQAWLSTLIHSDIFQAELRRRQLDVAARVAQSIPEKLQAVADIALEKLGDAVAQSEDPDFILDVADRALHRMGYAPASARNPAGAPSQLGIQNQTNVFVLAPDELERARNLMRLAARGEVDTAIEGEVTVVSSAA